MPTKEKIRQSWIVTAFVLALTLITSHAPKAQSQSNPEKMYQPGYVDDQDPLSLFASAALQPACQALVNGDLTTAKKMFAAELVKNPENEVAIVGLIQSLGPQDDAALAQYEQQAKISHSAYDAFKLGLVALYKAEVLLTSHEYSQKQLQRLDTDATWGLEKAYSEARSPVVSFILADATFVIDISLLPQMRPIYESLLSDLGGSHIYHQYLYARDHGWSTETPGVPPLSQQNLKILRRAVLKIASIEGTLIGRFVDGRNTFPPYSPSQLAAMSFLKGWAQKINTHIKPT